jgi:hypothetical protein
MAGTGYAPRSERTCTDRGRFEEVIETYRWDNRKKRGERKEADTTITSRRGRYKEEAG